MGLGQGPVAQESGDTKASGVGLTVGTVLAIAIVVGFAGLVLLWRRRRPPEASSEFGYDIEMPARAKQKPSSDSDWESAVDHLAAAG
jgi:hypothetical protein